MQRREFLKQLGITSAATMLPTHAMAKSTVAASVGPMSAITNVTAFQSSFSAIPETYGPTTVTFNQALPEGLSGTLFRNGPAQFQRGPTEFHHWFDGDGMIQSFVLSGRTLTHKANMVRTTRYKAEQAAGRYLWPGFGTSIADSRSVTKPDDMNVGNISVLPVQDELWALWEAGSAWNINPESLETLGRKTFSAETDGLPFSAHPRVDNDGTIWNFGYISGGDTLIVYDISARGELNRVKAINAPNTNMVHDFAITEQYLIFVLLPITFNAIDSENPPAFADMLGWDESAPVHIVMVNKSSLAIEHRFEMPSFFAFHFGNAWQDGKQVRVELAVADPWLEINQQIMQATQGLPRQNGVDALADEPTAMELIIDLQRNKVSVEKIPIIGGDFPVFDDRFLGSRTHRLTMLNRSSSLSSDAFGFNQIVQYDRNTQRTQQYDYGSDVLAEEHVFVPKTGAPQGVGWLIGTHYNWRKQLTSLSVFNAQEIADGPIATAALPYHLPLGLHGKFIASK